MFRNLIAGEWVEASRVSQRITDDSQRYAKLIQAGRITAK